MRYKDTLHFKILWDVKTLTWWNFKTTGLILLKFTGYYEWTHKALYTNFQSNLKFYKNIKIFSFNWYRWLLWSSICLGKLKELSYFLIFHENKLILSQN